METIFYIGLVQAIFTALLIGIKKEKLFADYVLFSWLIVIALNMAYLLFSPYLFSEFYKRVWGTFFFFLLYGPLLYSYSKAVTKGRKAFTKKNILYVIPFILLFVSGLFISEQGFSNFEYVGRFFSKGPNLIIKVIWAFIMLTSLIYFATKNMLLIKKYMLSFKDNFSSDSELDNLRWLRIINYIFLGGFVPMIAIGLFTSSTGLKIGFPPILFITLSLILLTFAVSFLGFIQPRLFHPSILERDESINKEGSTVKNLSSDALVEYTKKLTHFLENDKLYLNPELTLQQLADHIQLPKYQLTQLLNRHIKKNFYLLINQYRVEEAKMRLSNFEYKHLTVVAIGFDSGFKSKSTYNTIFKQETGQTPSEYRKSMCD